MEIIMCRKKKWIVYSSLSVLYYFMLPNMGSKLGFGVPGPWGFGDPSGLQGQGFMGPWGFRGSRDFRGSWDFRRSQFNLRRFWASRDLREPTDLKKGWYLFLGHWVMEQVAHRHFRMWSIFCSKCDQNSEQAKIAAEVWKYVRLKQDPKLKNLLNNYFQPSTWPTECLKFWWGHSNKGRLNEQVLQNLVGRPVQTVSFDGFCPV